MRVGREPVARAGLKLLDEVGLEGLTLRAIGAELGVRAPTLYWRFRNKQDLVDEMGSQVLADFAAAMLAAKPLPASWPQWTRCSAQRFRAELLRYRDGARMVAGTYLQDTTVYAVMETALSIFAAAKIAPDVAAVFLKTVNDYVIGFTIEQQAVVSPAGQRDSRYTAEVREARMDPDRYPLARSISATLFNDHDEVFKRGLDIIIAGFAAGLPRGGKAWRDFRQTLPAK
jgi:AcrR family transcriptional regulator